MIKTLQLSKNLFQYKLDGIKMGIKCARQVSEIVARHLSRRPFHLNVIEADLEIEVNVKLLHLLKCVFAELRNLHFAGRVMHILFAKIVIIREFSLNLHQNLQ